VYSITTLLDKNINIFAYTHLKIKIPNKMHYMSWVYPCCALNGTTSNGKGMRSKTSLTFASMSMEELCNKVINCDWPNPPRLVFLSVALVKGLK